jgi:cytochrome c2
MGAIRYTIAIAALALTSIANVSLCADGLAPSAIFANKCSSCHTFGQGDRVGPDLKGATTRHTRPWLTSWIRSSEQLIKTGDRIATDLFARYQRQRMPDHDLTDAEIAALIDYLDRGGPELDKGHAIRQASAATAEDIALGRRLFYGGVPIASGSLACGACHSLSREMTGATFGPTLGHVFARYQDKALDARLVRPCVRSAAIKNARVTDDESFAIRAFLRSVSR